MERSRLRPSRTACTQDVGAWAHPLSARNLTKHGHENTKAETTKKKRTRLFRVFVLPRDPLRHFHSTGADGDRRRAVGGAPAVGAEKHHRAADERSRETDGAELLVDRVGFSEFSELAVLVVDEGKQADRHSGDEQRRASPDERLRMGVRDRLFL